MLVVLWSYQLVNKGCSDLYTILQLANFLTDVWLFIKVFSGLHASLKEDLIS